jgi:hypothetical protein
MGTVGTLSPFDEPEWDLALERNPYWEDTSSSSANPSSVSNEVAGLFDYSGTDIVGDVPARIARCSWAADPVLRVWLGIKSENKVDDPSEFYPIWELNDGTTGTDASSDADATASSGSRITIANGGTAADSERVSINLNQVTSATLSEAPNQFGTMQWLLRTKVTAGTWRVYLRYGYTYMDDDDFIFGRKVDITNTDWDMIEMDVQTIPTRSLRAPEVATLRDQYVEIQVWAEQTSGTGDLYLDCLCPIPVDEGYLFFNVPVQGTTGTPFVYWGEAPDGTTAALVWNQVGFTNINEILTYSEHNFRLPPGDGRVVAAWARETTSDVTDDFDVGFTFYERWSALRGSE